ncbi:MAG: hypothetical protein LBB26_04445 [Puniceicoccales bacterium]|jgi:hypothetical protein|nr:hypothetical protein [Puniceicoccales bacterium]
MKSIADTTAPMTDVFYGDWKLQTFPVHGLTPGFKLEPPFLRGFPTFLGRASPLPAAKAIWKISP